MPGYIRSYGQTNVSLSSPNPRRSAEFYISVLGAHDVDHDESFVRIQTPGARDTVIFERSAKATGRLGSMAHFGFRLDSADGIDAAVEAVIAAGGEVVERGEFAPGEPYVFARDLDGYLLESWFDRASS